jgi:FkbM family methyltransferase
MMPKLVSKLRTLRVAAMNLGPWHTVRYLLQRLRHGAVAPGHPLSMTSKRARFPVAVRAHTSDIDVFGQIFIQREYRCLDEVREADLVIDCGANVGYSAAYFLSRYPASSVICVEPDPGNYVALESNLKPYADRVTALCSAVWSEKSGLVISEETFGDGREWARTVRAVRPGETATISAVDIDTLIRESGRERVSILKVDVEGAEEVIFAAGGVAWLDKVDNLVIELHGPRCERVFHEAIAGRGFSVTRCDELTVCRRL